MIDDTNQVANYNRYRIREIHATVRSLSPERKQALLDQIQLQKGAYNLIGREYNHQDCERIESLLNGKRPKNGGTK